MQEIRCKSCNKLLGKFEGIGEVKCSKTSCGMINKFNTKTKIHYVVRPHGHIPMEDRTTSSGVIFR